MNVVAPALAGAAVTSPDAAASDAPAPRSKGRTVTVLVASLAALAGMPWLVALAGRGGLTVAFVTWSVALVALGWGAARLAGTRLLPLRANAGAVAGGVGQGAFVFGWIVLALVAGHRLTGGGPGGGTIGSLLLGAGLLALQCAGEEVFFRGWLQTVLRRLLPDPAALPLAALIFGVAHLLGSSRAPLTLANLTLVGLWFGLLARRTGGLAMPIAAHWASSVPELLILGLYPNPGVGPWGAWRDYDITGAAMWGGGEEGNNANLLALLVVLGMVLWNAARARGRQAP